MNEFKSYTQQNFKELLRQKRVNIVTKIALANLQEHQKLHPAWQVTRESRDHLVHSFVTL